MVKEGFWEINLGGRGDSNPQPTAPQAAALPLSYVHHKTVGEAGFEPATSRSQSVRAKPLRHSPDLLCRGWESNPHVRCRTQDFKSCLSANSSTAAILFGDVDSNHDS